MKVQVTVVGKTPLLQNRFTGEKIDQNGSPEEQAAAVVYRNIDGQYYHPGEAFKRAMAQAGKQVQVPGRGKKTYFEYALSGTTVEPEVILMPEMKSHTGTCGLTVDSRRVVNPATRGAIIRHRPKFEKWSATFWMEIDDEILPPKVAKTLLEIAGQRVGVGDNRINGFGRFEVTSFKTEK